MKLLKEIFMNSKNKNKELKKKINIKNNYIITLDNQNNESRIILKEDNTTKLIGNYNFFGIYNNTTELWYWSNIIPSASIKQNKYIENLRLKAYIFEKNNNYSEIIFFFYQFLINDTMNVPKKYIGIIFDLLLYLSDDIYIFTPLDAKGNMQFIGLSKILELY